MAFPTGWGRKQKITIQSSQVAGSGSHSNFTFLVTLDHLNSEVVDTGGYSALATGGDIRFSSDSGGSTQLACEIVNFATHASPSSRACEIWVKVPSVSTSVNTDLYVWYNKAGESQPSVSDAYGRNAVWSGFDFLSHDMITDSTGNNTVTQNNAGTVVDSAWGSNAHQFDGSVDYHTATVTGITVDANTTLSMWGKPGGGDTFPRAVYIRDSSDWMAMGIDTDFSDGCWAFFSGSGSSSGSGDETNGTEGSGSWQHVVGKHSAVQTGQSIRVDKTTFDNNYSGWSPGVSTARMDIGRRSDDSNYYNGAMAWLGIRSGLISDDILDTEYNNQYNPSGFASAGTSEFITPLASIDSAGHTQIADNVVVTGGATPIEYVGGVSNSLGSNATAISLSLPTYQADDFALAFCYGDEAGTIGTWTETTAGGWTQLREDNHQTGRDRVTALFYKKLSGSETNPTFAFSASEEHSVSINIFRNVDPSTPFDVAETVLSNQNDATPPNAAITTAHDHAGLVLFHASTHDDIDTAGAPLGYTLATAINGQAFDHRQQVVAYQLGTGSAGLKSPGDWTHSVSVAATAEYSCYTVALRMAVDAEASLALSDSDHAHMVDAVALNQVHGLTLAGATHAHSVAIDGIIEHKTLITSQTVHTVISDSVTFNVSAALVPSNTQHGHTGEALLLNQDHAVVLNDGFHDFSSPQVTIGVAGSLGVHSSIHGLLSSGLNLGYSIDLVVDDGESGHFGDAVFFHQIHVLAVANLNHAQSVENIVFSTLINGEGAAHDMGSDVITMSQSHVLGDLGDRLNHNAGMPYVRPPPGLWSLVGEVITSWSEQSQASSNWTEQAKSTDEWSDQ